MVAVMVAMPLLRAFTPDLYRCAVGHAGVYDLQEMYDSAIFLNILVVYGS